MKELMKEVPPQIKEVFVSGKVEAVAKQLMSKNQLHVDQAAVVEREIVLLLLGLKSPEEFNQTLMREANLSQQVVSGIVQDINNQIFAPLRQRMMGKTAAPSASAKPPVSQPQRPRIEGPAPQARPQLPQPASPQPPHYFHLENKLSTPPPKAAQGTMSRPILPTPSVMPAPQKPAPIPQPPKPMQQQAPQLQKSALTQAIAGAQQRQSAPAKPQSINILPPPPKLDQSPATPTRTTVPAIAPLPPKTVLPQSMLPRPPMAPSVGGSRPGQPAAPRPAILIPPARPAAMPPPNLPDALPPVPSVPPMPKVEVPPVSPKSYSADPYREPIE